MRNRYVILLFAALTFLLYFPVLGNGFLTDDYASLYRLLIEKRVPFLEAVRPWIDITFYFNYLISGLHPWSYYVFNLIIHALTCYMVYRVAMDLPLFAERRQVAFALTAGLLFLFYPFHNEGVVWLSGRLPSMAALFGLLAVHLSLTKRWPWNFVPAVMCWFAGLFAYESILVLPVVVMLLEWVRFRDVRRVARSVVVWAGAGVVWLAMRYVLVGGVLPPYAAGATAGDGIGVRFLKVVGRCFLPPDENSQNMEILFAVLMLVLAVAHVLVWARLRRDAFTGTSRVGGQGRMLLGIEMAFLAALLPAVVFGVSTRTSEGDRLLYFPSCILSILVAGVLVTLVRNRVKRLVFTGMYILAAIPLIEGNNHNWIFASRTAEAGLDLVRQAPGKVVLVNIPDEWEGAYIFRNSFKEALTVNGIDTNRVTVTHVLTRLEYIRARGKQLGPAVNRTGICFYPATVLKSNPDSAQIYYWDMNEWKELFLDN